MKIKRVQGKPVTPPPEYILSMSYTELHSLYHMMREVAYGRQGGRIHVLNADEEAFYEALRNHA